MLRWFLADLRTGRQIQDIRPLDGSWKRALNTPEDVECTLNLLDPATRALGVRNTATVAKSVLAVADGDVVLGAGPIWAHAYDDDAGTLKLTAKGALSYYNFRYILPVLAASLPVGEFTVPDPAEPTGTIPNPVLTTTISGVDLGTIAKRLMEQAHAWTGGSIPVVFPADRVGDHERTFIGPEFKNLGEALAQLSEVDGGPDIRLRPQFTADRLGIEWELQTGTDADPLLASPVVHRWTVGLPKATATGLRVETDASSMTALAWATGGRQDDEVMVARSSDSTLTDTGFPLLEQVDSSHTSVSDQRTLDGYAKEATTLGRRPLEVWSFTAQAAIRPFLGTYLEGDWCDLDIPPFQAAEPGRARRGVPLVPEGGIMRQRILSIGGSYGSPDVSIECMPKVGVL